MTSHELVADFAVLPHTIASRTRIAVHDGRITVIDSAAPSPRAQHVAGTLLPGFVDLQVNGAGGRSCAEATPAALDVVARAVLEGGATSFLPTLITTPWPLLLQQVANVAAWIENGPRGGAEPIGLHVEGPFLEVAGAHDTSAIVEPTEQRVDQLLAAARGRLRLVTLASSAKGAAAATARLRAAGVAVAIGHVADPRGFAECVDAGATMATHLFNAMGAIHHREPGIAGRVLDDARLACGLILDGVHVHPAMVRNAFSILGPSRTVLVSDATAAAGMPDGEYRLAETAVRSEGGVVRDAKGNLAGSALTMARAAHNFLAMVPNAGPWTLARAASTNAARLVGRADLGVLAVGARADFAVLSADGRVEALRR